MDLGVRDHFNLPKIHSMGHYIPSIHLFGTTDNYNTEQTKRLHVELTKGAFNASNHKDIRSQMSMWVVRREKIQDHTAYIKWRQEQVIASSASSIGPPQPGARSLKIVKHPTLKAVSFDDLAYKYGATDFQDTLVDFIAQTNHPTTSGAALSQLAADTLIPFHSVPVDVKTTKLTNHSIAGTVFIDDSHINKRMSITSVITMGIKPGPLDTVPTSSPGSYTTQSLPPASLWDSTASDHITHELADLACLVIGEVTVVFCRYECAYGLFFFDILLITCLPGVGSERNTVHHKIKFTNSDNTIVNSIQIRPEQKDARGCSIPSRFDTVLVHGKNDSMHGINGHRIAQVRVVFEIPNKLIREVFPSSDIVLMPPEHLAYVEWFSPIPINPGPHHLLYKRTLVSHFWPAIAAMA
ncbi:hypothetical protein EI94DRAFT_1886708 [Lactarius quietus]|nr:hypothetical protein EI94DRAFT_1886708 [Lactarius quietus]